MSTEEYKWKRDNMGDYVVTIDTYKETGIPPVSGRIIRCHIVHRFAKRFWQTQSRWLLLVNNNFYGFHRSLKACIDRFDKDCVPKGKCPDCGQPNGSDKCCQKSDLWK